MDTEERNEGTEPINEEQKRGLARKASIGILLVVFFLFAGVVLFTGFLGNLFGKTAENIALGIVAVFLILLLYKSRKS